MEVLTVLVFHITVFRYMTSWSFVDRCEVWSDSFWTEIKMTLLLPAWTSVTRGRSSSLLSHLQLCINLLSNILLSTNGHFTFVVLVYPQDVQSPYTWLIFCLFYYVCLLWLGMTLYDLAAQCGNEFLTKPWQASTQGCIFLLLVLCCMKLTVAEISNYLIEELLLASVWLHKKTAQVKWWMRWWHHFSSDLESHAHAEQLTVHEFLIEAYSCQWIDHGFATPPSPIL